MARKLSNWIRSYMAFTSTMEAPDPFHFWTAVSTIAGALRRRVWIDMGHFQWTPNFYVIFVAPPGIVSKSTTLSIGMSMLREIKDVKFGPDAVTMAALVQALAGSRIDFPLNGAFVPMSALTIVSSEFGTFLNPHDREMIDVLVDLWDNRTGSWEKLTKTSGNDSVVNPWINLAACTTPAWIAGNFPEYMVGGGFTSRCVFVYAEKKRRLIAYPFLEMEPKEYKDTRKLLVDDLQDIARMGGAVTLSKEAVDFGSTWYEDHYKEGNNKDLANSQFAGYLARKQTHIHKLAIVLSAADTDSLIITKDHLSAATAIITSLEADMPQVFRNIGLEGGTKYAAAVLDIIKAYGKVEKRVLWRMCFGKMTAQDFSSALDGCLATGFVEAFANGTSIYYVYKADKPVSIPPSA